MFRKLTIAMVPALVFALATFCMNESASEALAKGGHGGGHRSGGHAVSHRSGGHRSVSHRASGNRSVSHRASGNRSAAHKAIHAKHSPKGHGRWHRYGFGSDAEFDGDADFAAEGDGVNSITLVNPQETRATVGYTLDSAQYSLDPAQSQVYDGGTQVIAFDRGGSFGQAQYTLQPGTYRFVATDRGWDLRTVTEQVAAN